MQDEQQTAPAVYRKLGGLVPPLVTPFTATGALDGESLSDLCQFLIEAGVDGLFPCGTTGEFVFLSSEERRAITECVLEIVAGKVPVVVQTGCAATAETIALSEHAATHGADGVAVITPYFYRYTNDELYEHFVAVARAVAPLPLYLYNLPAYAGNRLTPVLAYRLYQEAPNIVGAKDSSGDIEGIAALRQVTPGPLLSGADGLNLAALRLGCDGMISGNANAVPEPFVALMRAWRLGDAPAAEEAQRRINSVRTLLSSAAAIGNFKSVLVARGVLRSETVRAPQSQGRNGVELLNLLKSMDIALTVQHG
ncbi:MAG: dihydrodipicolinate synthase family protein [Chloroflexi bacterium]|nr:dihydrodipicolinate synthase family protein [Chloroflexota bacterium]